jgi:probable selenium-dependent hydroxylase accessory protein YqeC
MALLEAFGISSVERECIALVGGGGKTTTMFAFARALKEEGRRVLVTTTTNIFMPQEDQYDRLILSDAPDAALFANIRPGTVTCLAGTVMEGKKKLKSIDPVFLDHLHTNALFDAVIVEADGARRLPIKAPAEYEPVIPACATLTVGCIGLDALGLPVDEEHVHRPQLLCAATGAQPNEILGVEHIVRLITAPDGLFKGAPGTGRTTVLLNKADTDELRCQARLILEILLERAPGVGVVIASMAQQVVYQYRHA